MNKIVAIFAILAVLNFIEIVDSKEPKHLAPYIKACSRSDAQINECVVNHANEAIKTLVKGDKSKKIPNLLPLKVDEIVLEPGNNLKLIMKNIEVYGIENVKVISAKVDLDKMEIAADLELNRAEIDGDYDVNGKLLILPITGKGRANMTLENIVFHYTLKYGREEVDGIEQVVYKDSIVEYTPQNVFYDLTNLFNGDKRLGDEMLKFMNENWKEIDGELGGGLRETLKALIRNIIENEIKDIPFDEVILP